MGKRQAIILISAAVALASCTVNTRYPVAQQRVVFSAVASHTRGIISTTNYPVTVPFVVEAVHHPAGSGATNSLMSGLKVEYDYENGWWQTEDELFWPQDGEVVFYAGSPVIPQVSVNPEKGVEADWSIYTLDEAQVDLCIAKTTVRCAEHSALVPIVFNHALTQVCVKARTLRHYSTSQRVDNIVQADIITVVLDSVKITGVISEGHYTQNPQNWVTDPAKTAEYTIYSSQNGLELGCDRYDNPVLNYLNSVLLIPQILPDEARIEEWHHCVVRSSVTDVTTGTIISDVTYSIPGFATLPIRNCCHKWIPDYKYTFRVAVGMEESTLNLAVTDWIETREIILGDE